MNGREEVLDKVRKFAGYEDIPDAVELKDNNTIMVAGIVEIPLEEAEDDEKIKERLRAMGYLASECE